MLFSQRYAGRSGATMEAGAFRLTVATEASRPPVHLQATVADGLAYARAMRTLYTVVTGNLLSPRKDRTEYFAWVQERYLEELPAEQLAQHAALPALQAQQEALKVRIAELSGEMATLSRSANSTEFWAAQREYYNYLYKYDRDLWYALDPVVSVHPDCLIFEAFSQDESSYGRVTVPMERLQIRGDVAYGTTNIDFSPDLAREIARVRSYRAADLEIGPQAVALATDAGAVVEKKIDLPPTWVRGFLQVQSAATLPALDLRLSAATLADILSVIRRRHERGGPRSLRFRLTPGQTPTIVVEPWGVEIAERTHPFTGATAQEVRIWGRRRLLVLADLLPHAEEVAVRLLGTGLPSYWSITAGGIRLDVGLSGWTQNDWSRAAQFDLLASIKAPDAGQLKAVAATLQETLFAAPEGIALRTGLPREAATAALQALCREGRAMFDYTTGVYRWRQLFPVLPEPSATSEDPRLAAARRLLERRAVTWSVPPARAGAAGRQAAGAGTQSSGWRTFHFKDAVSDKFWNILLAGSETIVHFGRSGTDGQRQQKDHGTPQAARTAHDKLVREKTGKGYRETTPPAPPPAVAAPEPSAAQGATRFIATVKGEKAFDVTLDVDLDGRVVYAHCSCGTFRRDKLRKGPCPHILATSVAAARHGAALEARV